MMDGPGLQVSRYPYIIYDIYIYIYDDVMFKRCKGLQSTGGSNAIHFHVFVSQSQRVGFPPPCVV